MRTALLLAVLASVPAQYLVFEIDRADRITLVGAETVDVASLPESSSDSMLAAEDPRRIDVEVRDANGQTIYRTSERVDRYVRAEFHDGEPRWLEAERVPFVVRVPAGGATIEVRAPRSRTVSQFAVERRPPSAAGAVEATTATEAFGAPRVDATNSANRLDILIMGDGYTAAETAKFDTDANRIASQFFGIVPYSSYRSFVNVKTHFVASQESGADHPNCADGGEDPKEGTFVKTAFDATFCSAGLQRLLTVDSGKVFLAASAVPEWDMVMVVVNDSMYGGAGGAVSVVSTNGAAVGVAQHEFGHSFTDLADEYSTPYPSYPPCSDVQLGTRCEANVTDVAARAAIKWAPFIDATTVLPSPPSFNGVGLFLGARYQASGFYRPKNDCLMHHLGVAFCEVCAQAYVLRLYNGWTRTAHVDLIESITPANANVAAIAGQPVSFQATLLQPDGGAARVRWLVDGVEVGGAAAANFTFTPARGTHSVELRVTDPTTLVNPAMAGTALTKSRTWTVVASDPATAKKRRAIH